MNDLSFYNPTVAKHAEVTQIHYCDLQAMDDIKFVERHFIRQQLAWPALTLDSDLEDSSFQSIPALAKSAIREMVILGATEQTQSSMACNCKVQSNYSSGVQSTPESRDVYYVRMIGGSYFWGHVGQNSVASVIFINDRLSSALANLKNIPAKKEEVVAVVLKVKGVDSDYNIFRGKVLEHEHDTVTVFALDFGFIKIVKDTQIFGLSGSLSTLSNIPSQAKVCCLSGQ